MWVIVSGVRESSSVGIGGDVVLVDEPDGVTVPIDRSDVVAVFGEPRRSVSGCSVRLEVFDGSRGEFGGRAVVEVARHTAASSVGPLNGGGRVAGLPDPPQH